MEIYHAGSTVSGLVSHQKGKQDMKITKSFYINYMSKKNKSLWIWVDIKWFDFWYVFLWRKKNYPYMYKSKDATPPTKDNCGKWIFQFAKKVEIGRE